MRQLGRIGLQMHTNQSEESIVKPCRHFSSHEKGCQQSLDPSNSVPGRHFSLTLTCVIPSTEYADLSEEHPIIFEDCRLPRHEQ